MGCGQILVSKKLEVRCHGVAHPLSQGFKGKISPGGRNDRKRSKSQGMRIRVEVLS